MNEWMQRRRKNVKVKNEKWRKKSINKAILKKFFKVWIWNLIFWTNKQTNNQQISFQIWCTSIVAQFPRQSVEFYFFSFMFKKTFVQKVICQTFNTFEETLEHKKNEVHSKLVGLENEEREEIKRKEKKRKRGATKLIWDSKIKLPIIQKIKEIIKNKNK